MEPSRDILLCSARFLQSLTEGRGIQHLIDIAYELLGNPIFVTDAGHKVLAYTKSAEVDDPDWYSIVEKGYVSFNIAANAEIKELYKQAIKNKAPVITPKADKNFDILRSPVTVDNKVLGYLTIPGYFQPFTEDKVQIAALLSNVLSLEMQKNKLVRNSKGIIYEYFIADLLNRKMPNREIMAERLKLLAWNLQPKIYVLTIRAKQYDMENVSYHDIMECLHRLDKDSKAVLYNDDIVWIVTTGRKFFRPEAEFQSLLGLLQAKHLHMGISRCFHALEDIGDYYRQSVRAIELGSLLDKRKLLFSYEDYVLYDMLDICARRENIKLFCHPALFVLAEYDRKNNTDFMRCLETYLVNDKNLVESASILHVHRNTMSYRIEKIKAILNLNMDDKNTSLHLLLSFKILEFAGVAGSLSQEAGSKKTNA